MLNQVQKTAIRRHLGVPFAGTAQAGRLYGWRFTWYNEDLEYRMNNLQPAEEQLVTGVSLGSFRIDGNPAVGNTITFTLDDGTNHVVVPYTVQASDFVAPANPVNPSESSPLYSIAQNAVRALRVAFGSNGYTAVAIMPADLFSPTYTAPYFAEVIITGPGSNTFTLSASQSGNTNLGVSQQGVASPAVATISGIAKYGYVSILDALAMGMTQADLSLAYMKADVVDFRRDEVSARRALYREYCTMLTRHLGGESYVQKFGGGNSSGAVA